MAIQITKRAITSFPSSVTLFCLLMIVLRPEYIFVKTNEHVEPSNTSKAVARLPADLSRCSGNLVYSDYILLRTERFLIRQADLDCTVGFCAEGRKTCTPIVSAMKAYRRDHGHLPDRWDDIAPDYIKTPRGPAIIDDGKFHWYAGYNHMIEYDFSPGAEGWFIHGPYTQGRIPAPPAPVGPTTSPATRPSS